MKNLLYFLLGFVVVFSFALCSAENYPGSCTKIFYAYPASWSTSSVNTYAYTAPVFDFITGTATATPYAKGAGYQYGPINFILAYYDKDRSPLHWVVKVSGNGNSYLADWSNFSINYSQAIKISSLSDMNTNYFEINYPSCNMNCADADSDGVCDQCDVAPNDSTLGKTGYVKGYYEYNGKMVAGLTSFSPENSTYDAIEIYEHDPEIPGYVLGLGMPTYINESEFLAGGGKFVALQTPEQTYEMSCPAVTLLDQCEQIECEIKPVGSSATNELPNNGKGETEVAETEQKAEDAGMLDLDKTCDQLRSKCASSCGGATNIQSFACSENEHMVCQCLSNGSWELAKDWSEVGKQITITETTTVPSYGTGDSPSGGGSTTSVNGSSDGSLTGSYGYVEGNINYDTLSSHFSQFNSKFPFSLRSTLGSIYSEFKGSGAAPVYTYSVYGKTVTIDLAAWNDIAKMIRSFFALGITLSTIVLLIYLYVGIDLRGK